MFRVAVGLGLVGALLLLQRPEAELSPYVSDKEPFYPGWPEPVRRFINGGLYRGLIGFLYDAGVRHPGVVHSYEIIWKYKIEDAEAVRTGTVPPSLIGRVVS